jgi:Ca2+-binding RTX toxin-like protein
MYPRRESKIHTIPLSAEEFKNMASITGTEGNDTLKGTEGDDIILALGGDDTIIGSNGSDTIVGGDGTDLLDYSSLLGGITITQAPDGVSFIVKKSGGGQDTFSGIERLSNSFPNLNFIGTEAADTVRSVNVDYNTLTGGNDTIKTLGGNDRIIGSTGADVVDGGAGNDTLDFTGTTLSSSTTTNSLGPLGPIYLSTDGNLVTNRTNPRAIQYPGSLISTTLTSVETIIGDPTQSNTIEELYNTSSTTQRKEIDLSKNQLIAYDSSNNARIVNFQNFDNVNVVFGSSRIVGNDRDNIIKNGDGLRGPGRSDDLIIGSKGNDTLDGGNGKNVLDYSNLGRAVKVALGPRLADVVSYPGGPTFTQLFQNGTTDKGSFGKDKIVNFQTIIGATNKENTLDMTTSIDGASVDLNLATNSLKVNIPVIPNSYPTAQTYQYEIVNFVNAVGTKGNDTIVGANKNSKLTGSGGNDSITGGNKNDRITGSDSTARGVGEVDTLTGGGGKDKFILGDKNGAYYVGKGSNDYALITDFNLFQDSIDLGKLKNYSFALSGNNTIDLFSGKDVNTRDLVAKIQISGGISSIGSNSKSVMGNDASLNAITARIEIGSET